MKIVLAPDSFKECMDAQPVCHFLEMGIRQVIPDATVVIQPMADGGEGSAKVLMESLSLPSKIVAVSDPLGTVVEARYGLDSDRRLAVVEAAQANGLALVPRHCRNPMITSTKGCGELLMDAITSGAETIYVCVGGSSTVDGAKDLATVFGYRFLDKTGCGLPPGGGSLVNLDHIESPRSRPWGHCHITVLCDVTNPLLGEHGAARVFAPQKGATPEMVSQLEAGLCQLSMCIKRDLGVDCGEVAGGGAAGGLGAGLLAFFGAKLRPGAQVILDIVNFDQQVSGADLVITGEGRSDSQTLSGKVPQAVAQRARARGVPVYLISGDIADKDVLNKSGLFDGMHALRRPGETTEVSIEQSSQRLRLAGQDVANLLIINGMENK